jgi:hypothetical protein
MFTFDNSAIPHIDVITEPGDLMYFPPLWWHEVHNLAPDFGFGIALRPGNRDVYWGIVGTLFPRLTSHECVPLDTGVTMGLATKLCRAAYPTNTNEGGGNSVRQQIMLDLLGAADDHGTAFFSHFEDRQGGLNAELRGIWRQPADPGSSSPTKT